MRTRLALMLLALGFFSSPKDSLAADVLLYKPDSTVAYYKAAGSDYASVVGVWKAFFERQKIAYQEVNSFELANAKGRVLVLPSALALASNEQAAIDAKLAQGLGLLGTWAVGARDGVGKWQGYGLIERWFSAKVQADVRADSEDRFLLPFGETPLTGIIPAGKRIYLGKFDAPMLRVQAKHAAARASMWARDSSPAERMLPVVAFDENAKARRVYFGFPEAAWLTAGEPLDQLIRESIDWLRRVPSAHKSPWPYPAQSALFLEMDTEDKYDNALVFAKHLEDRGLRSTFYSTTSVAANSPATVKRLAQKHEIALHGDLHEGFKSQTADQQRQRFTNQFAQMRSILGQQWAPAGFRAPLESFDDTTETEMRRAGIGHHVSGVNASNAMLPYFANYEGRQPNSEEALVSIPRQMLDDVNYVTMGLNKREQVAAALQAALADVINTRGLGLLSVHTQNFFPAGVLDREIPPLLDKVVQSKGEIWFPTGSEVENWWREQARVRLETRLKPDGGLRLQLKVLGKGARNLRVNLILPQAGLERVELAAAPNSPSRLGTSKVKVQSLDRFRTALVFESLQAGDYLFDVNFR